MRVVDPKIAQMIATDVELHWKLGMEPNTLAFNMVAWDRKTGKFYHYSGVLTDVAMTETPGDERDYEWLQNIGAIE